MVNCEGSHEFVATASADGTFKASLCESCGFTPDEIQAHEEKMQFQTVTRELLNLQHWMDDVAKTAALKINEIRGKINFKFESNKVFLKNYGIEHAATNKKTGEKKKHYRDGDIGGGLYYTAVPDKYSFQVGTDGFPWEIAGLLKDNGIDLTAFIGEKKTITHYFKNERALYEVLKRVAPNREYAIYSKTPGDAYGRMTVGVERGWTPNKAKQILTKAIEGLLEIEEPEEDE